MNEDDWPEVTARQEQMFRNFRSVPPEGQIVEYLGKHFKVTNGVFWPTDDSKPLVENYVVNEGDKVLDVCTGSGVIAIFSAYKGASKVLGVDINPDATACARENAKIHNFEKIVSFMWSDVFSAVPQGEKYDVITMNPPFRCSVKAYDEVEATMRDNDLHVHTEFFNGVREHLADNGRAYISQASFGPLGKIVGLASKAGFELKPIGEKFVDTYNVPRTFYAFQLRSKI